MNRFLLPIVLLLLAPLLAGSAFVQPQLDAVAEDLPFSHLFVGHASPNAYSHTEIDASGGIHIVYIASYQVYYTFCPSNCADPGQWTITFVHDTHTPYAMHPSLALTSQGAPRLMWYDYEAKDYWYAECSGICTNKDNWKAILVDNGGTPIFDHYFALDSQGRPRFVFPRSNSFIYASCSSACHLEDSWKFSEVPGLSLSALQLALTTNDQPRVTGLVDGILHYFACDSNCTGAGAWNYVSLAGAASNYAFRLDPQDRPRLAYYSPTETDTGLYYAWSDGNPLDEDTWLGYKLDLPANRNAIDLRITAQGFPRAAYVSDTSGLSYAECTANCQSGGASWQHQAIETNTQLDQAVPLPPSSPTCTVEGWKVGRHISFALDSAGSPYASYHVSNSELCGETRQVLGYKIRFAFGGESPIPTAPTIVTITGPSSGVQETELRFTASVSPASASLPITFEWSVTGQPTLTRTLASLSDEVVFTWPAGETGTKTLTVTVSNAAGSTSISRTITILESEPLFDYLYLPMLRK